MDTKKGMESSKNVSDPQSKKLTRELEEQRRQPQSGVSPKDAAGSDENEGEGSRTADRKYREGVERFARAHDVDELADRAKRDVESDESGYKAAEEEGKRHIAEEDPELRRT